MAEVDEKYAGRRMDRAEGNARSAAEGRNVTEKKARAYQEPGYVAAGEELSEAYAYRRAVQSLHESVGADVFVCSRELSRRLGSADLDRRSARHST
jgi:hypothetical protein